MKSNFTQYVFVLCIFMLRVTRHAEHSKLFQSKKLWNLLVFLWWLTLSFVCVAIQCCPGSGLGQDVDCVEGMGSLRAQKNNTRAAMFGEGQWRPATSELAVGGRKHCMLGRVVSAWPMGACFSPPRGRLLCVSSVKGPTCLNTEGQRRWESCFIQMHCDCTGYFGSLQYPPLGNRLSSCPSRPCQILVNLSGRRPRGRRDCETHPRPLWLIALIFQ